MRLALALLLCGVTTMSGAEMRSEEVSYSADGIEMNGYIAWDDSMDGPRPGVIVVHEWWGHNDYARFRADALAELGYTALAMDMYGDGKTAEHPDDAGAFMNAVLEDLPGMRARFEAALELLKNHPSVDESRTAAIGYCFGGGVVLHMARMGADLDAVASFHGSLPLGVVEDGPDAVNARVAVYNGEADGFIPAEAIAAFRSEMDRTGAHYDFVQLPGALHGFSNPAATSNGERFGLPLRYDALADEASWAHMQMVFRETFGSSEP